LSVPFYPCHFVRTILSMPFCPHHCVHAILSVPVCSIPFCRVTCSSIHFSPHFKLFRILIHRLTLRLTFDRPILPVLNIHCPPTSSDYSPKLSVFPDDSGFLNSLASTIRNECALAGDFLFLSTLHLTLFYLAPLASYHRSTLSNICQLPDSHRKSHPWPSQHNHPLHTFYLLRYHSALNITDHYFSMTTTSYYGSIELEQVTLVP